MSNLEEASELGPPIGARSDSRRVSPGSADAMDEMAVGGKAAGLGRLVAAGARVPPFRVIPTSVFRAHLRDPGVTAAIGEAMLVLGDLPDPSRSEPAALEAVCERLRDAVEGAELAAAARTAIEAGMSDVGPGPYAVRSSMVGEDSNAHSFAGQLRTELFCVTPEEVMDAVRRCWASAFTPQMLIYGGRAGIAPTDVHLALVLQAMVDADLAGVAFSANPLTGARDECVVTAAYGLGEGVVADLAPADTYVWSPDDGERSIDLADKDVKVVRSASGSGTELRAVAPEARNARALTPEQVAEIGARTTSVAAVLGRPVDLEWALRDGKLFVLQARPITALPADPAGRHAERIFDNSNIQESYNGVTTPLTFSFAARLYEIVYAESLRTLGASPQTLTDFAPASRSMLGLIDGQVFYNLASWRQLLEALPRGRRNVANVESIMFRTTIGTGEPVTRSWQERLQKGRETARMGSRLLVGLARQDAIVDEFIVRFERFSDRIDRRTLRSKSLDELAQLLRELEVELVARAAPSYRNDLRMAIVSGRLRSQLAEAFGEKEADARMADLLGGIAGIESVEPTRQLMAIAREIRADAALAARLRAVGNEHVIATVRDAAPQIAARIDAYVERYGDRVIGELKLESVSLRDDERFLGAVLRNYTDSPDRDLEAQLRAEQERAERTAQELAKRLPAWRRRLLHREVDLARRAVSCRERLRLRRTWTFGIARDVYGAIGSHLHAAGVLEDPRDVLFLTVDEIDHFLEGRAVSTRLAPIAAARKAEFAGHVGNAPPDRFQTVGNPYLGERLDLDTLVSVGADNVLQGLGCCAGVIEAPVRVIMDPSESLTLNGEILCTVRTDPGWAPLFPTAGGLIVERGSMLSHSAVVARELGIPTVVGIQGVTKLLRDGERVRLNGGTGVVERLEAERT